MSDIDLTRAPNLAVPHGFLGRTGGVSAGELAGLNCGPGSDDDPALVTENRRRARAAATGGLPISSVYQVHGTRCMTLDTPWDEGDRPHADALVTRIPGRSLAIVTADCAPVLFADAEAGVIGAAHAGWKGAIGGVTDTTIAAMEALGAARHRIHAAIGPCIARASYEVSDDFAETFAAADPENERFFATGRPGHPHFDLEGYVAHRLRAAGIASVWTAGLDTCALEDRYFSYRRATLRGENGYGRNISLIALGNA